MSIVEGVGVVLEEGSEGAGLGVAEDEEVEEEGAGDGIVAGDGTKDDVFSSALAWLLVSEFMSSKPSSLIEELEEERGLRGEADCLG